MKLIPEARSAWRMYSVQALALLAAIPLVWETIPPEVQDMLPEQYRPVILTAVALGGLAGRLLKQGAAK